ARPQIIISAFAGLFSRRDESRSDVLRHIELPIWISFVGIPIIGAVGVWMAHDWFGVNWIYGATAIPLIIVLTLIAANSTALTGITPTGAMSKIPQFIYGAVDYKTPATNLMTGVMCIEVASNASNLLMDIKPGYMLGAKPRQQAIGHCIGIIAGALASTPLTGITPTGAMSKIPQFIYGAVDYKTPATNLMTGVMCIEVASNASNLLMDIKPGYMLGAKPRQQAIGHCIGIIAGALASTP